MVKALGDTSPSVRIVAAEALGKYGEEGDLSNVLSTLIGLADPLQSGAYVSMQALSAIDALGAKAAPLKQKIALLPKADPTAPERVRTEYISRLIAEIETKL